MIYVELNDKIKKLARWAEQYKTKNITSGGNYTRLEEPDRFYNGTIGEIALFKLLKDNGCKFDYFFNLSGKADSGDFCIYIMHRPITLDIKTACKDFHQYLMITESQYERHKYQAYVGAKLNGNRCEIYGYNIGIEQTQLINKGVPAFSRKFEDLSKIEHLIKKMDKGEYNLYINGDIKAESQDRLQEFFKTL